LITTPESKAGANERAGFIDAPEIKAKKKISKPTIPPMVIPLKPFKPLVWLRHKYADACNLFGSVETVKRKLSILNEHCKSVGRDYDSILKTKLGGVVIEDDRESARKRSQQIIKMPEEQVDEFAIYGMLEDVLRQKELFEEAGIQYFYSGSGPF
jgi:hypothetical protein